MRNIRYARGGDRYVEEVVVEERIDHWSILDNLAAEDSSDRSTRRLVVEEVHHTLTIKWCQNYDLIKWPVH